MTKSELEKENLELKIELAKKQEVKPKEIFVHKLGEIFTDGDKNGFLACTCGFSIWINCDYQRNKMHNHYWEANAKERKIAKEQNGEL